MKTLLLLILNTITLILTLVVNYLAGTGLIFDASVGEISDRYQTLITPAGYAFSIWGLIYLLLIAFVAYQWYGWEKNQNNESLEPTGIWFAVSNIVNALWIVAWINGAIGYSLILMSILLAVLLILIFRLKLEVWDAPLRIIAFVWWPICIYTGWIITASLTNVAAYLVSIGWQGGPFAQKTWAILMIIVAALIYLLLIFTRNMREAALVGTWALIAIAVARWGAYQGVATAALIAALLLFIAASYHGYQNRHTSPVEKWRRGE